MADDPGAASSPFSRSLRPQRSAPDSMDSDGGGVDSADPGSSDPKGPRESATDRPGAGVAAVRPGAAELVGIGSPSDSDRPTASIASIATPAPAADVLALAPDRPGAPAARPVTGGLLMQPQLPPAGIAGPSSNSAGIAGPSSNPAICPFLRAVDDDDVLTAATETPHPANRCAAMSEVVPQSLRQQDLVCLTSGHVNCPRFLRGVPLARVPVVPVARARPSISWPILGSILVLVSAFIGSVAFVVSRGGIDMAAAALPIRSPAAFSSAQAVASVAPSVALVTLAPATAAPLTPAPTTPPTPTPVPTPTPTPSAKPTPKPTARPTATPTARPTARPTVKPVSSRYAVLERCSSGVKNCWVYTLRSGDNLYSIANYFGIPLATIYDRNPWTRTESLRAGRELILPAPRR